LQQPLEIKIERPAVAKQQAARSMAQSDAGSG
jgi:hypothetical protein